MAIIEKKIDTLDDEKHTTRLKTTVDVSEAIRQVQEANASGGRIGSGSGEMWIEFRVPQELWALDPLLKKADWYRRHGDMGQFTRYIRMWKKLNPQFCVEHQKKVFATR